MVELSDPTLFALPSPVGFSGKAWLIPGPLPRPIFESIEPEVWLTQSVAGLGTLPDHAGGKNNRIRYRTFDQKLAPVVSRIEAPPLPFPQRSSVRVDGPEGRALINMPELPSVTHADVLANTVVQAGIAPSGFPISVVVLNGSGSATADQVALDATRGVRFKPLAVRDPLAVAWATFTFRWHTVVPTNPPPLTVPLR
jgi:TonB family protein